MELRKQLISGVLLTVLTLMIAFVINSYIIDAIDYLSTSRNQTFLWRTIYTAIIVVIGILIIVYFLPKLGTPSKDVGVKKLAENTIVELEKQNTIVELEKKIP